MKYDPWRLASAVPLKAVGSDLFSIRSLRRKCADQIRAARRAGPDMNALHGLSTSAWRARSKPSPLIGWTRLLYLQLCVFFTLIFHSTALLLADGLQTGKWFRTECQSARLQSEEWKLYLKQQISPPPCCSSVHRNIRRLLGITSHCSEKFINTKASDIFKVHWCVWGSH